MGATLSLKRASKTEALEDLELQAGPAFDPNAHFGEVGGIEGVRYVQGRSLYDNLRRYVGPAPKEMWMTPLTAEQERQRRLQMSKSAKLLGTAKSLIAQAAIPQRIIDAERENARARAAESQVS